jgi:hypothetical protein
VGFPDIPYPRTLNQTNRSKNRLLIVKSIVYAWCTWSHGSHVYCSSLHACMHACIPVYHLWICVWIVLKNLHISCNMHTSDKNYRKCTCHTHLTLQFKCCDYMPCACNIIIIIICPLHFTWYWKHPSITQLIYVFVGTSGCSCIYFYIN